MYAGTDSHIPVPQLRAVNKKLIWRNAMKKRLFIPAAALLTLALLTSCGGSDENTLQPDTSSAPETQPITSPSSMAASVKSEEDIIKDLSEREEFFSLFDVHCLDIDGVFLGSDYDIKELAITRRKVDETAETDDVYVTVTSNNGSSNHVGDFHLLYTLYDVGGWYLDIIEMESGQLKPNSGVSDVDAYTVALSLLAPMGADASDSWIESHSSFKDNEETVTIAVDFNDGILDIEGTIDLYFHHNGRVWEYMSDYTAYLSYDILIDGTYEDNGNYGYPNYLVLTHENDAPTVRSGNRWGGGVDGLNVQDWKFDCLSRSYTYWGGIDNTAYIQYYFAPDGTIHYFIDGVEYDYFTRITDPITDRDALWDYLVSAGRV